MTGPDRSRLPDASVVVRTKDSARTLGRAMASLRNQSVKAEIIVVDSGSKDGTLEIAGELADRVTTMESRDFSFGRALNLGARIASGEIIFALSSHCEAESATWIEDSLRHYEDETVAATNGSVNDPDGCRLTAPLVLGEEILSVSPYWGFANHASSWRRSVWESEPFDEELGACEDKEWSFRIVKRAMRIAFDPALVVTDKHRRRQGKRALLKRVMAESESIVRITGRDPISFPAAFGAWWSEFDYASRYPVFVRRAGVSRSIEIFGRYAGERRGHSKAGLRATI